MAKKNDRIIDELFALARDREKVYRAKFAAAIAYKGKIVAYGFNQERTSHLARRFKKNPHANWLHAEVDAVKNALKVLDQDELSKSTLYVVRAKKTDDKKSDAFGDAKPCEGCRQCIEWFDIKRVYYSTEDGGYEELKD